MSDIQKITKECGKCHGTGTEDFIDSGDPQNPVPGIMECQDCNGDGVRHLGYLNDDLINFLEDMNEKLDSILEKVNE